MNFLNMLGIEGGINAENMGNILNDPEKVAQFLPIISNIADSFKLEGEQSVIAMVSIEENTPFIRVVATKIVKDENGEDFLALSRNVNNPQTGEPLKINLIDLMKNSQINEKQP